MISFENILFTSYYFMFIYYSNSSSILTQNLMYDNKYIKIFWEFLSIGTIIIILFLNTSIFRKRNFMAIKSFFEHIYLAITFLSTN